MWLLVIFLVSIWMLCGRWKGRKLRQIAREIGSDIPQWPIVGHSYLYFGGDERRMKALECFGSEAIKHGGCCHVWFYDKLSICVADPALLDFIFKSCLQKDSFLTDILYDAFGHMSTLAPVAIWRPRRKILAGLFSLKLLNGFMEIFTSQSSMLVEQLKPTIGAGDVSLWPFLTKCTFEIITGIKLNAQTQDHHIGRYIDHTLQIVSRRVFHPWLHWHLLYRLCPDYWRCRKMINYANNFVEKVIKDKRKSANGQQDADTKFQTFLDVMVEDTRFTDVEVREEAIFSMFAGTDGISTSLGFSLVLLSRYSTVQDTVYEELYEVFGNSDQPVASEDLPKLKYLEVVIKESLRLYPPLPLITREVSSDIKLPSGTTLVKGVLFQLNLWSMHRNPRYWGDDADKFRPERFFEGLRHPAQFAPFSYGNRNCLGAQHAMTTMKIILATLLRTYRVLPPSGLDPNHLQDPLRIKYHIMLRHVDDLNVRLEKRI